MTAALPHGCQQRNAVLVVPAFALQFTDRRTALVGDSEARSGWWARRAGGYLKRTSSTLPPLLFSLCAPHAHAHSVVTVTQQTPMTTSLAYTIPSVYTVPARLCRKILGQAYYVYTWPGILSCLTWLFIRTVCNAHFIVGTHAAHARLCRAIGPTQTPRDTSPSAAQPLLSSPVRAAVFVQNEPVARSFLRSWSHGFLKRVFATRARRDLIQFSLSKLLKIKLAPLMND